ncbi:hypothetical protein G9A89_006968 [Geosiphon pyriformis]|nr:hypothetical protein G9A89_006968 [Geosiphon pyriformis]
MGSNFVDQPLNKHKLQLGDCLGKGAFGSVYRALNLETGEAFAVKQVKLSNIRKSELDVIMMEINLLRNLNHANIVKYIGFEKTKESLFIILEYCENGSLHTICKKFGKFPENLVAVYISQVLEGLLYLHEQGVIHRDIKGANILTTKQGLVKLADFGVATKTSTLNDGSVVGSPYWMAPEIIELSGATTKSDVWSVGCVVIELLEGKPPYSHLDPMPALYAIVQDEHPPLPESASPAVKNFLMHCFQKDPNLRVTAKKLLKHPWIANSRKTASIDSLQNNIVTTEYDEVVQSVKEWNRALNYDSNTKLTPRKMRRDSISNKTPPSSPRIQYKPLLGIASTSSNYLAPIETNWAFSPTVVGSTITNDNQRSSAFLEADAEGDNWDDDFEDSIHVSKIIALQKDQHQQQGEPASNELDDISTIRPNEYQLEKIKDLHVPTSISSIRLSASPGKEQKSPRKLSLIAIPDKKPSSISKPLNSKLNESKGKPSRPKGLRRNSEPHHSYNYSKKNTVKQPHSRSIDFTNKPLPPLPGEFPKYRYLSPPTSPISPTTLVNPPTMIYTPVTGRKRSQSTSSNFSPRLNQNYENGFPEKFRQYVESSEETYDDALDNENNDGQNLKLNSVLSSNSWRGDDNSDEDDPFIEIDEGLSEMDLQANIARDKHVRACARLGDLLNALRPKETEDRLLNTCNELSRLFNEHKELKNHFLIFHGVIPILELLELCSYEKVIGKLLAIVNTIIEDNQNLKENFCLVGGIPVIKSFTSKRYSYDTRLRAAHFIHHVCNQSTMTLLMFVSCRSFKVLVDFLEEDYHEHKKLVQIAINAIWNIFELTSKPKNDFCRQFVTSGLLGPLSVTLHQTILDQDSEAATYVEKICKIFQIFSMSESFVKESMATSPVIARILDDLDKLPHDLLVIMLKTIKNLSMNSKTLESLESAAAIEILTRILIQQDPTHHLEVANQVLNTMFNMCRLNKSRQEKAAHAGMIGYLQFYVHSKSPLKQFALPILCEMAHANRACRELLRKQGGLEFYILLLKDPYWQVNALDAILVWLQEDFAEVEATLLKPNNLDCIVQTFITANVNSFENILEPLHMITRLSPKVARGLSQPSFFQRLTSRLRHSKAVVRVNMLRILRSLFDADSTIVDKYQNLTEISDQMSRDDPSMLVRELARELLEGYFKNSKEQSPKKPPSPIKEEDELFQQTKQESIAVPVCNERENDQVKGSGENEDPKTYCDSSNSKNNIVISAGIGFREYLQESNLNLKPILSSTHRKHTSELHSHKFGGPETSSHLRNTSRIDNQNLSQVGIAVRRETSSIDLTPRRISIEPNLTDFYPPVPTSSSLHPSPPQTSPRPLSHPPYTALSNSHSHTTSSASSSTSPKFEHQLAPTVELNAPDTSKTSLTKSIQFPYQDIRRRSKPEKFRSFSLQPPETKSETQDNERVTPEQPIKEEIATFVSVATVASHNSIKSIEYSCKCPLCVMSWVKARFRRGKNRKKKYRKQKTIVTSVISEPEPELEMEPLGK